MGRTALTVTEHGQVDHVHQDHRALDRAVRNCDTVAALQNGSTLVGVERVHVARKTTRLALRPSRRGDGVGLGDLGDGGNRLRSLGGLGRSHAGLSVGRERDLVHFGGLFCQVWVMYVWVEGLMRVG